MGVQNVNNSGNTYNAYLANQTAAKKNESVEEIEEVNSEAVKNNISDGSETAKTNKYKPDSATLNEIFSAQKNYLRNMQNLVNNLLQQAKTGRVATSGNDNKSFDSSLSNWDIDSIRSKAVSDISEDGYYGVKQTSERILNFAKALTGGDSSKIEEMRKSIEKAFSDVRKMFGGKLPEISEKTYDAIMKGLDEWATEGTSAE